MRRAVRALKPAHGRGGFLILMSGTGSHVEHHLAVGRMKVWHQAHLVEEISRNTTLDDQRRPSRQGDLKTPPSASADFRSGLSPLLTTGAGGRPNRPR